MATLTTKAPAGSGARGAVAPPLTMLHLLCYTYYGYTYYATLTMATLTMLHLLWQHLLCYTYYATLTMATLTPMAPGGSGARGAAAPPLTMLHLLCYTYYGNPNYYGTSRERSAGRRYLPWLHLLWLHLLWHQEGVERRAQ
eukprot:scaffold8591_cov44-Phaeocystis_antarctica.AAC.2